MAKREQITLIGRTDYNTSYPPRDAKKGYVAKISGTAAGSLKFNDIMATYRLSNRQQKELLIRGQQLTIAVPAPDTDDADFERAFAERSLPEVSEHITDAWVQLLRVALPGTGDGISRLLGTIISPHTIASHSQIEVSIEVVIITLRPTRCRGEIKRVQWPGDKIE